MAETIQPASAYLVRLNAAIDVVCRRKSCSRTALLAEHFSDEKYIAKKLSPRNARHKVNRHDHKRLMSALKDNASSEELRALQAGFEAYWLKESSGDLRELGESEINRLGIPVDGLVDDGHLNFLLDVFVERPRAKGDFALALKNIESVRGLLEVSNIKQDQRFHDRVAYLRLREFAVHHQIGDVAGMAAVARESGRAKAGSAFQRRIRLITEVTYPATMFFRRTLSAAQALDPSRQAVKRIHTAYIELADMMREIQHESDSAYWRLTPEAFRTPGDHNVLSASAYLAPDSVNDVMRAHEAYMRTLIGLGPLRTFEVALFASQAALFCQSTEDPDRGLSILETAFAHAKAMRSKAGIAELNLNAAELHVQKALLDRRSQRDAALATAHKHLSLAYNELQDPRTHAPLRERAMICAAALGRTGLFSFPT